MDFLKKNYEKILLGVVLLGLAIAVAFLPVKIRSEEDELTAKKEGLINPRIQMLSNLDLTLSEAALQRMATLAVIDFSKPNKLFNPMPWQRTPDGHLIPGSSVGPSAAVVTNITPLYLKLTLDSVSVLDSGPKYVIGIEKEAAATAAGRLKKGAYCSTNPPTKNDTFTMLEVKGSKPEEPSEVIVELNDTGEKAVITKDKPFKRVDGYMASLRYEPEKRSWDKRRVGAVISFNNEDYKIVVINSNEVVLSAPNQKKWTIKYNPAP
jgi:hypothetical protein